MSDAEKLAEEIHHRAVRKYRHRKVLVSGVDEIWSMDLAFMDAYAQYNKGYKVLLCVIDVFSKYGWCVPLKDKTAPSILGAVKKIVADSGRSPGKIWVDQGSEFYNKHFLAWAQENDITVYSTHWDGKAVVAERFIRTIKEMLFKKFTSTNSRDWLKLLGPALEKYNNRVHKTILMTPTEASQTDNEVQVYNNLHRDSSQAPKKKHKPKFAVGDNVRISRIKEKFEKGYEPNYTFEVFVISSVQDTDPVTYKLTDYLGEPITGGFYEQELIKTSVPDYREVETVLKTRQKGKSKQYFVKFYGWPDKYNDWVDKNDFVRRPK